MASRLDRLKTWMFSKPTAEELEAARTPTYAEANRLDEKELRENSAAVGDALKSAGEFSFRHSPAGMAYDFLTEDPEAEAELARVAKNPTAGPASPTAEQAALLAAHRRLANNPTEGPVYSPPAPTAARKGKPVAQGTGGSGPPAPTPIRPDVRAYLAQRAAPVTDEKDTELEAAQAEADDRRMMANAGRAGATISAAFADQAPGTHQGFWDEQAKGADQSVKDLQARRDAARTKKGERQADEDRARTLALDDATSDASKQARELFLARHPDQAKRFGDRLQLFSANAITRLDPSIEKELDRAHQLRMRREDNAAELRRAQLAASGKAGGVDKDQKKSLTEIQDRHKNIKDQLGQLRQLVGKYGTNEFLGGHNKILEQKLTSVATDMAKLVDPNSVARESEVQTFRKMLFEPGLWQRDSSALEVLGSFEQMVDDRLGNAYQVRGLEAPTATPVKMVDPDGDVHEVPAAEVAAARRKGLREAG